MDDPPIDDSFGKRCIIDDKETILEIQESFNWTSRLLKEAYIRNGEGFMFVYSTTSRKSFEEISGLYQDVLRVKGDVSICAVIVVTKSDLQQQRQVSTQEGRELAERLLCQFIETSSRERINVDESFYTITREIQSNKEAQNKNDNPADKSGVSGCRCLVL
ncbi:Ras GTPase [Entomortierella chlamydospora]|uniref:Ras GTPase n=1 Tax=Entomortierella chlamydospora TaxID=101097 RepID=A0A9P6T4H4_9FUNG|nr:Ras GTPase [Entomortierella chlamydospora]